jgi:regulator of protease activity HflC (stomatin/prohibitin superfamily)
MKTILNFCLVGILLISMSSCYRVKPDGDQESVLIKKPLFFGHGGVDEEPISAGATWCVWTTDHKEFTITPQTIAEEFDNMIPSDNTPVSFSAYLKCQIIKGKTPELYKNFGENWYSNNLSATFRTMVRDYASEYTMFELASKRTISSSLEKKIFEKIKEYVEKIDLPVEVLQVSIGQITPPQEVLNETKNTSAQNQSILTQDARAKAELSRKQAEINKAIADKSYQNEMGMSIQQYLMLRQLEIEKEKIDLIKDHKNVTIIFGQGSVPTTFPIK